MGVVACLATLPCLHPTTGCDLATGRLIRFTCSGSRTVPLPRPALAIRGEEIFGMPSSTDRGPFPSNMTSSTKAPCAPIPR